jgi:hypothetical protein
MTLEVYDLNNVRHDFVVPQKAIRKQFDHLIRYTWKDEVSGEKRELNLSLAGISVYYVRKLEA